MSTTAFEICETLPSKDDVIFALCSAVGRHPLEFYGYKVTENPLLEARASVIECFIHEGHIDNIMKVDVKRKFTSAQIRNADVYPSIAENIQIQQQLIDALEKAAMVLQENENEDYPGNKHRHVNRLFARAGFLQDCLDRFKESIGE